METEIEWLNWLRWDTYITSQLKISYMLGVHHMDKLDIFMN